MLKNIKTIYCPICGCDEIIKEYVDTTNFNKPEVQQHSNGTRWEHRHFLCGYKVNYEPNYSKETESPSSECFYDSKVIARKEKEKEDKERLLQLLKDNNISNELIGRVKMHCLY